MFRSLREHLVWKLAGFSQTFCGFPTFKANIEVRNLCRETNIGKGKMGAVGNSLRCGVSADVGYQSPGCRVFVL